MLHHRSRSNKATRRLLSLALCAALVGAPVADAFAAVTKDQIAQMAQLGLGDDAIKGAIDSAEIGRASQATSSTTSSPPATSPEATLAPDPDLDPAPALDPVLDPALDPRLARRRPRRT